jgi:hypothetical protein
MKKSTDDDRSYYINKESNISQWGIVPKDLPIGWEMLRSRKNDTIYYYNKQSNISQIAKPDESDASKLPDGWIAMRTKKCGSVFYKNTDTNTTQWHFPEDSSEKIEVRSGPGYEQDDIGTFKDFNLKLARRGALKQEEMRKRQTKHSDDDYKTSQSDFDEDYETTQSDFGEDYETSQSDSGEDYETTESQSDFDDSREVPLQNGSKQRKSSEIILEIPPPREYYLDYDGVYLI